MPVPTSPNKTTPRQRKDILRRYLYLKVELEDWHGVADVAVDIRELEAKHPELKRTHQPG